MNKRAKQRLIGVTVLILVVVGALIYFSGVLGSGAQNVALAEVAGDKAYVGKRVEVSGQVVAGSWVAGADPFVFDIEDGEAEGDGAKLTIVSAKPAPGSFGDGTTATIIGVVNEDGTVQAETITTKCPSKYESETGALTVSDVINRQSDLVGTTLKVAGYVVKGSIQAVGGPERFRLIENSETTAELSVSFGGGLSDEITDGTKLIVTGSIEADGVFQATEVALQKSEQ